MNKIKINRNIFLCNLFNSNNNNKIHLLINETISSILFEQSYIGLYDENNIGIKEYLYFCDNINGKRTTRINSNK